jgi:arylsulfatase A
MKAAVGMAAGGASAPGAAPTGRKPNIVFVLADDLGIANVGCYGADIFKTPNIDRLAQGGMRFTHGYTAPLCGPSRAIIMTGRYAFRTGATNQDATGRMKPSVETFMPRVLKPAGYVTACVGKWGQLPLGPAEFGFDEYLKFSGSGVYWNTQDKGKNYTVNGRVLSLRDREYLPDVMHNFLVDFMTRNREKPFYAYYSLSHVHAEILPTPDSKPDSRDLYSDNISYMDKLVGKLVADLDRLKLRENTLIVFVGDNGTGGAYADESTIGGRRLSGEKGSMLEGGALVPLIVNWPSRTPVGKVSADMIDSSDFLPTLAEVAGAKLPENTILDGRSFAPQLRGQKGNPRDWVYIQLAGMWYAREAGWKLDQAGKLYNMSRAPFEEPVVAADTKDPAAIAARKRLRTVLDKLNPAGGILDDGDGTGRHANRQTNLKKKRKKNQERP